MYYMKRRKTKSAAILSIVMVLLVSCLMQLNVFAASQGGLAEVGTLAEFKSALQNKNVATIQLTNDIQMDSSGVKIEGNRVHSELTIDGKNKQTGEWYTLTDNKSGKIQYQNNHKNTLTKITMQNLNIIGQNTHGTIYIYDAVKNLKQEYINIKYTGPKLTYNCSGDVRYENADITITAVDHAQVAEAGTVTLAGNVNITKNGKSNYAVFWLKNHSSAFTVEEDANVEVNVASNATIYGLIHSASKYPFTVKEGASFTYNGFHKFHSTSLSSLTVEKNASMDVTIVNPAGHNVIDVHGPVVVGEDASFVVNTNGNVHKSLLSTSGDVTVNNGAVFKLISENNQEKHVDYAIFTPKGKVLFDNPEYALIYTDNPSTHKYSRAMAFLHKNQLKINAWRVRYWDINAMKQSGGPSVLENESSLWQNQGLDLGNTGNYIFNVEGTIESYHPGTFSKHYPFTVTNYNGTYPLTRDTFNTVGQKIIEINGLRNDPPEPEPEPCECPAVTMERVIEGNEDIAGKGQPGATVGMYFGDKYVESVVRSSGFWSITVPDGHRLEPGDILVVTQYCIDSACSNCELCPKTDTGVVQHGAR